MDFLNKTNRTDESEIERLESQKQEAYAALGEYFYTQYQQFLNEQGENFVQKINDINTKIIEYQNRIKESNSVKYCVFCNSEISEDAVFCSVCGKKVENTLEKQSIADEKLCKQCGEKIEDWQKFCINCGARLETDKEI